MRFVSPVLSGTVLAISSTPGVISGFKRIGCSRAKHGGYLSRLKSRQLRCVSYHRWGHQLFLDSGVPAPCATLANIVRCHLLRSVQHHAVELVHRDFVSSSSSCNDQQ